MTTTTPDPTTQQREYRALDGRGNNPVDPTRAAAPGLMSRGPEGADYADGLRRPMDRGNERTISRRLFSVGPDLVDREAPDLNMISVLFGQFLNHDLEDNHFFDHWNDNNKSFVTPDSPYQFVWVLDEDDPIATFRGINRVRNGEPCGVPFKPSTGKVVDGVFYPGNLNTGFLDLGQIYGPEPELAESLRAFQGGRLKHDDYKGTSVYRTVFGPVQVDYDVPNLPASRATTDAFIDTSYTRLKPEEVVTAGDPRASENMGLLQMQVLFFREHNWRADQLAAANPTWDDEQLFQEARRLTIATWQHVLVDEWAATVFGPDMTDQLGPYRGYDPSIDASTSVVFATLALRYGHSQLNPYAPRDENGAHSIRTGVEALPEDGTLPNVGQINNGISPMAHYGLAGGTPEHILRGMLATRANPVGIVYSEAIHDIAFVSGGTDLLTLDLARGRDNGLPPYHAIRQAWGGFGDEGAWDGTGMVDNITETQKRALIDAGKKLERRSGMENFLRFVAADPQNPTNDEQVVADIIREIYRRADSIDPMVGVLAEPKVEGSVVGRTLQNILADQLRRSRDGDRFWYENDQLTPAELAEIKGTTMRDLLVRHFDLTDVPDEAFRTLTYGESA
jgi:peroxidase